MRAIVQRVENAKVEVEGEVRGSIDRGFGCTSSCRRGRYR